MRRRYTDSELDSLDDMAGFLAIKGPALRDLIDEIRWHRSRNSEKSIHLATASASECGACGQKWSAHDVGGDCPPPNKEAKP